MKILIDYCDVNNSIDGYLFDNINSILYLYITNSTSYFYSKLVYEDNLQAEEPIFLDYIPHEQLKNLIAKNDMSALDYFSFVEL